VSVPLIFVWIGQELPKWALDSLKISHKSCGLKTILLTNSSVKKCKFVNTHIYIENFYNDILSTDKNFNLTNNFRDGFWIRTIERFLVLRSYAIQQNIKQFFHAELDNIIFNISELSKKLDAVGKGFFCPRDSYDRGIASLVYINESSTLDSFSVINFENVGGKSNDMTFLGYKLKTSKIFHTLPTENIFGPKDNEIWKYINPDDIGGLFDAASLGQYIFGIDKRNTFLPSFNRFVNENSGRYLKDLIFHLNLSRNICELELPNTTKRINLYNLHVHSKIFSLINDHDKLTALICKINNGKRTLIKSSFGHEC
jgi:hypothetical protein